MAPSNKKPSSKTPDSLNDSPNDWQSGKIIKESDVASVPEVKRHGMKKISQSPAVDPVIRADEEKFNHKSKEDIYQPQIKPETTETSRIIAESDDSLEGSYEDSIARKLLSNKDWKGRGLFNSPETKKPKSDK